MRALKLAGAALAGLLIVILVMLAVAALDGAALARWALAHPLSQALGRHIAANGPVRLVWGVPMRLVADDIAIVDPGAGAPATVLRAQRLELGLSPASVMAARWHVPLIALDHPTLWLQLPGGGGGSWHVIRQMLLPDTESGAPKLDRLVLRDAVLILRTGPGAAAIQAKLASLDIDAGASPLAITATGSLQDLQLQLAGRFGTTAPTGGVKTFAVDVEGGLGDDRLAIHGTLARPLDLAGPDVQLRLSGSHLQAIAAALGLRLAPLPALEASGVLSGGDGRWSLKSLALHLGHSDLAGDIDLDTRATPPRLAARLSAQAIDTADLAGLVALTGPAAPRGSGDRVIPATPVSTLTPLGLGADLAVSFEVGHLRAEGAPPLEGVTAALEVSRGALRLDPLRFGVAGGTVAASLAFDTGAEPAALALDIDLHRIDLRRLVRESELPALFRQTSGMAGGFAHLHGNGRSLREVMARLNGDTGLFAEHGRFNAALEQLTNPGVLQALGLAGTENAAIPVNCLVSRFAINSGVATATSLLLDTDASTVTGSGNVNLAAETIYLDLTPHPKHIEPLHLAAPIELRGTFAHPQAEISKVSLLARLGAALGVGLVAPPAALLALVDAGLGENSACRDAFAAPARAPEPAVGSSAVQPAPAPAQRKPAR